MRVNELLDPKKNGTAADALAGGLHARIVGQDEAVRQIVSVYQTFAAGMNSPGRPVGSFLFLGPTGTGKTRIVEALAETLVGDAGAVVKIDCAEFQHSHEIAKLIGSPPGYLGHRETHPLLGQDVLNAHHTEKVKLSFVLFDEIEKASDALWNLLLGILDKATLTLGDNRKVDFSRAMIFMTSNLGASAMSALMKPGMGFAVPKSEEALAGKIERTGVEAARRRFTPEFMNRIDRTVVFHPLGAEQLHQILDIELDELRTRIRESRQAVPFAFSLAQGAREYLLREGADSRYGARHLKRAIDRALVHPLAGLVASGQVAAGDHLRVEYDAKQNGMTFYRDGEMAVPSAVPGPAVEPEPGRKAATAATAAPARVRAIK